MAKAKGNKPVRPQRERDQPDDDDDDDAGGDKGSKGLLIAGVRARLAGKPIPAASLAFARNHPAFSARAGINSLNEGRNILYHVWFATGQDDKIVEACRVQKRNGDFGREHFAQTSYYYAMLAEEEAHVYRLLVNAGRFDDAEDVRLAIRSHLAWDSLVAVNHPLTFDISIQAGVVYEGEHAISGEPRYTPAVVGNRQTDIERTGNTGRLAENAHAELLVDAIDRPARFGITDHERDLMVRVIERHDRVAAAEVATWMFGGLELPGTTNKRGEEVWGVVYKYDLVKVETAPGEFGCYTVFTTECVDADGRRIPGCGVGGQKPPGGYCEVTHDGRRTILKASPRGQKKDIIIDWRTSIEGGVVTVESTAGKSTHPVLAGREVWRVTVDGGRATLQ